MGTYIVSYSVKKMQEGYIVQCTTNPVATAYGKTVDEATDNLVRSLREYLSIYPDKIEMMFAPPTKEVSIGG